LGSIYDIDSALNKIHQRKPHCWFLCLAFCLWLFNLRAFGEVIVGRISSETLNSRQLDEVLELLKIKKGQKLDLKSLDKEIRKVADGKRFGNVRVWLEKSKDGRPELRIDGVRLTQVGQIDWGAVEPFLGAEGALTKRLSSGDRLDLNKLKEVQDQATQAARDQGYPNAIVQYELKEAGDGKSTDLQFRVDLGQRQKIERLVFKGAETDVLQGVKNRFKLRQGDFFNKKVLEESVTTAQAFLVQNQYPLSKIKWDVQSGSSPLEIVVVCEIELGQQFRFLFKGNEALDTSTLRDMIGSDLLGQVDLSSRIKRLIEDRYRTLGYHFVNVEVRNQSNSSQLAQVVEIKIQEGHKVLIDAMTFDGLWNEVLGDPADIYFESAVGVLNRRVFWEAGLEESNQRFVKSLRERGFLSATVTGPRIFFSDDKKGVALFFDLQLGHLYQIKKITIEGNKNVPDSVIQEALSISVGDLVNRDSLRTSGEMVRARVQSWGYLDAQVVLEERSGEVIPGKREEGMEIAIKITEGKKYEVGSIRIEGLNRTQEKVVLRELVFKTGEPFDPEKVRQSEENIALLGLFSRVELVSSSSSEAPQIKNITVIVSEIKPGFGEVGLGALYEDPLFRARTFLGIGYRNLFGLNQTASLRSEVSLPISRSNVLIPFIEYAAIANYRAPYLADLPIVFTAQGGFDSFQVASSTDGKTSDLQTKARLEERIEKRLSRRLTAQYRLHRLERTRTEVLQRQDSGLTNTLSDTIDVIGSTGPVLLLDFRNDLFNPTSGSFHVLDVEFAHPALLSNAGLSFLLALQRNSFYIPLSSRVGFACYVGLGWSRALLDKGLPEARLANELALGGQGTIRGYAPRLFRAPSGIREIAFYNVRSEVTIPLFGEVSGAVFFDSGQLFPEFRTEPRNDGVGVGVRYRTPVGPIVLDLAHGLSPAAESVVRFTFSVGSI